MAMCGAREWRCALSTSQIEGHRSHSRYPVSPPVVWLGGCDSEEVWFGRSGGRELSDLPDGRNAR